MEDKEIVFRCAYKNMSGHQRYIAAIDRIIDEGWYSEYREWRDSQWDDDEYRDLPPDADLVAEWRQHERERSA